MKKSKFGEAVLWGVSLIPLLAGAILYPSLPDRIPTHWNIHGAIDSYGGKSSALIIPLIIIGMNLMFIFLPKIDPKYKNYERFGEAYYAIRLCVIIFMGFIYGITLYASFNPGNLRINLLIPACVGILFAVMGNFMPKFKHNYFVGIRTPWTLASEDVWYKTHRLAGVLWFFGGILSAFLAFVLPSSVYYIVFMIVVFVISIIPAVYSYLIYHKNEGKQ